MSGFHPLDRAFNEERKVSMRQVTSLLVLIIVVFCASAAAQSSNSVAIVSGANPNVGLTADSLASVFGPQISTTTQSAAVAPWPTSLGDIPSVVVRDSAGNTMNAGILFVSPDQMNIWIPAGVAAGPATISFPFTGLPPGQGTAALRVNPVTIQKVAPGLFSANGAGSGVAAASAIRVLAGSQIVTPIPVFSCDAMDNCTATAIALGVDTPIYLSLYGTGIRGASSLQNVSVTIGNVQVQPTYAGPQMATPGLDQLNVGIPLALRGSGLVNVTVTVDGVVSNPVQIRIQ